MHGWPFSEAAVKTKNDPPAFVEWLARRIKRIADDEFDRALLYGDEKEE